MAAHAKPFTLLHWLVSHTAIQGLQYYSLSLCLSVSLSVSVYPPPPPPHSPGTLLLGVLSVVLTRSQPQSVSWVHVSLEVQKGLEKYTTQLESDCCFPAKRAAFCRSGCGTGGLSTVWRNIQQREGEYYFIASNNKTASCTRYGCADAAGGCWGKPDTA